MSDKTYSKNVKTTTYKFDGSIAGMAPRQFVAVAKGDTTTKDTLAVFAFLTRSMRAQLRAEDSELASLWAVVPTSVTSKVESVRYEITDADFMRIGTLCADRVEAVKFDMTRTISAGTAVLAWELASAGGICTVSAPCNPSDMAPADYLKWYAGAIAEARKQVARTLCKEYGMEPAAAKKAAKLVSPTLNSFKAGKSGLYGVTFAQLEPYKVAADEQEHEQDA